MVILPPMSKHRTQRAFGRFDLRQARLRLMVPLAFGLAAALAIGDVGFRRRLIVGWDVASLLLLALTWHTLWRTDAHETERRASADDPGRTAVNLITVMASAFSFFAAVSLLAEPGARTRPEASLWTWLSLAGVLSAWVLTHTTWTFRYAHLYYNAPPAARRAGPAKADAPTPLVFPGVQAPSDSDFAYFAFTIGMTFQVSDVVIACPRMRRATLAHALLSFLYNTGILAVAINLAAAGA